MTCFTHGENNEEIPELRAMLRAANGVDTGMHRLTEAHVVARDAYQELDRYEREKLLIIAQARTARSATLTTRSAALLWGMPIMRDLRERDGVSTVELTRPSGTKTSGRDITAAGVSHSRTTIPAEHITTLDGISLTRPGRTAADLARKRSILEGVMAMDWLLRNARGPELSLLQECLSLRRIRGIRQARHCFELCDARAESPLESAARVVLVTGGFPWVRSLEPQAHVSLGSMNAMADFLINERIILEVDGASKYFGSYGRSTDQELFYERKREKHLQNAGYLVVRVTAKQIFADCKPLLGHPALRNSRPVLPPARMRRSGPVYFSDANPPNPSESHQFSSNGMVAILREADRRLARMGSTVLGRG